MAVANGESVSAIVAGVLHNTVKDHIRRRFIEMVTKDVEAVLEEYTKQIVSQVAEMRDPTKIHDLKINVLFKLPNPEDLRNGS